MIVTYFRVFARSKSLHVLIKRSASPTMKTVVPVVNVLTVAQENLAVSILRTDAYNAAH